VERHDWPPGTHLVDNGADMRKLAAAGHWRLIDVAVSPRRLGHRKPVLLAVRNGTVSMWETFGIRLGDPFRPTRRPARLSGIVALPGPDYGITVVTASRAEPSLRIWDRCTATLRSCRSTSGRAACSTQARTYLAADGIDLPSDLLDRIDQIVPPGVTINVVDNMWNFGTPALSAAFRRR
jgi:hypothetical protein